MKTSRIGAALVVTLAMFAADRAFAADVPTATGGSDVPAAGTSTVVLNTYSKVWVSGDNRGPAKLGKDTGAGLMDPNFGWDDLSYATDKSKVNLITTFTRSADTPTNQNNSYMQGGFAIAQLTAKGVVPGIEADLPNLNGDRNWQRPQAQFLSGNRVLLIAASVDNGVDGNNPQPCAFVADATTGKVLGIPNNTRGANNLNKPTNLIQQGLRDGLNINNPNDQRGPHSMVRTTGDTFVLGMQYNNQAQEGFSVTVNPDNSIKMNWLTRYSNNAQHCRPQVQIAPGATTGYIAAVEANTQPADIGFRVSEFNVQTGKAVQSKIVIKSDPNNNKYVSEPVMGLAGDKLAITFGLSSKARNKGNNNDGHAGGRQVDNAVLVDKATLTAIGTPVIGMGQYGRHGSSFVTNYGPNGEPALAVISGSSTGTGGGFIQMVPLNTDGTLGAKDAAKVYSVSPFSDVANVPTRGKQNPNNQGRGFINGMGGIPNPGYTTDATAAATNFMPEVKEFSLSAVAGYSGPDAMGTGLKNSIWLSLVPASWQPGIVTIPGNATATPGTNPDGTGPSPRTTSNGTGASSDSVVPDSPDDATHPNGKSRAPVDSADSSGCNATGSTSSSNFGLIGLAIAGVIVAARRKRTVKGEEV